MIKKIIVFIIFLLSSNIFSWGMLTHKNFAVKLLDDPPIAKLIIKGGFNKDQILNITSFEPPDNIHHPGWARISDWETFKFTWGTWGINDTSIAQLIHILVDCAVPVNHFPAGHVYDDSNWDYKFENLIEAQSEFNGTPPYPDDYNISISDYIYFHEFYNNYTDAHKIEMYSLANEFKSHNENTFPCNFKPLPCDCSWITPDCHTAGFKLAKKVLYIYLWCYVYDTWGIETTDQLGKPPMTVNLMMYLLSGDKTLLNEIINN